MRSIGPFLLFLSASLSGGVLSGQTSASGTCALLTAEEVAAVQEVAVVDATAAEQVRDGLAVSRCFYRAADYGRSVHLELMRRDPAGAGVATPAARWHELFHREEEAEPGEPRKSRRFSEEGSQAVPSADARGEAQAVEGLGDEAFWVGTAVYGALYVLEGEVYLRLSVGGGGDLAAKLARARRLAEQVLGRLAPAAS